MLRSQRLATVVAFAVLTLAGCLGQDPERVRVRRDPKVIDEEERRIRPDAYEDWLTEQDAKAESLRLTPALKRERNHYENARVRVSRILDGIHDDPFADYEKDRLEILYRNWADHGRSPPPPESEILAKAKQAEDAEKDDEAAGGDGDDEDEDEDEDEGDDDEDDDEDEDDDDE